MIQISTYRSLTKIKFRLTLNQDASILLLKLKYFHNLDPANFLADMSKTWDCKFSAGNSGDISVDILGSRLVYIIKLPDTDFITCPDTLKTASLNPLCV